jgi:hypothetical protein
MRSPVVQALLNARLQEASTFGKWCIIKGIQSLPVSPVHVAAFVRDSEPLLPIDKIWEEVQDVSRSHLSNGFADPTAGGPVSAAINAIAKIDPPRSWPGAEKDRFKALPYDLQVYFARHEERREKEIRRAQNEAAMARKALAAIQQPAIEATNGTSENCAA